MKKSLSNVIVEKDFWVNLVGLEPEINNSLKMEVGIEDTLHIEFEYNKAKSSSFPLLYPSLIYFYLF